MPRPPHPHAPDHLQSSPTLSAYTPVSLRCTLHKLAQPRHSCHWTKLGSMSNFPRLCPYVSGHHLFVLSWYSSSALSTHPRPSLIISHSVYLHSSLTPIHAIYASTTIPFLSRYYLLIY